MDDLLFPIVKLDELEVDDIKNQREILKETYARKEKEILDAAREKMLRITKKTKDNYQMTSTSQDEYPGRLESLNNKNLISENGNNNSPEDTLVMATKRKRQRLNAEIEEEKTKY